MLLFAPALQALAAGTYFRWSFSEVIRASLSLIMACSHAVTFYKLSNSRGGHGALPLCAESVDLVFGSLTWQKMKEKTASQRLTVDGPNKQHKFAKQLLAVGVLAVLVRTRCEVHHHRHGVPPLHLCAQVL